MMKFATEKVRTPRYHCILTFNVYFLYEVIYQCALEQDLEVFDAGDRTEVGEKGLTLRSVFVCPLLTSSNNFPQWWAKGD